MTEVKTGAAAAPTALPAGGGQRLYWADLLRICATLLVILIHEAAQSFYVVPAGGRDYAAMIAYDAPAHIAVPLFVMLSGMLFLNPLKKMSFQKLYGKYILRIAAALLFWEVVYTAVYCYYDQDWSFDNITSRFTSITHLWFCFMIIGLYMLLPVLKKIAENKTVCAYFLAICFVFTCAAPTLFQLADAVDAEKFLLLQKLIGRMHFQMPALYPCYFLLGYLVANYDFQKSQRLLLYGGAVICVVMEVVLSVLLARSTGERPTFFFDNTSPLNVIAAVGVFVFFRYVFGSVRLHPRVQKWIVCLSGDTFGIYLVHLLVRNVLQKEFEIDTMCFSPWLSLPVLTLLIFVISAVISRVLHLIPGVKKFLV